MKYLVFLFWFFLSFQEVRYTKEKEWVVKSFEDFKEKKIIPSGFYDGEQEYKIRPNDLWLYFEDQNTVKVKLPTGVVELKTKGFRSRCGRPSTALHYSRCPSELNVVRFLSRATLERNIEGSYGQTNVSALPRPLCLPIAYP